MPAFDYSPARGFLNRFPDCCATSTEHDNIKPQNPNQNTVPAGQDTANDEGAAEKAWIDCAKSEQQEIFLKNLMKQKIGTRDIENFPKGQQKTRKLGKNRIREESIIITSLKPKIEDAEQAAMKARQIKSKERKN